MTIRTKPPSKEFSDNYDSIFRKKETSRIDVIGQNGPTGEHYDALCDVCAKEKSKVTECAYRACPVMLESK